jgi:hypothetical protein
VSRITLDFEQTGRGETYCEGVVTATRDGEPLGRVVLFAASGSDKPDDHPLFSVDVKPTDWKNWCARLFGFRGEQRRDRNDGRPYMTERTGQVEHEGLLFYTVYALPKDAR